LQRPIRKLTARSIRAISPQSWARAFHLTRPFIPKSWHAAQMGNKVHKFAELLECSRNELYLTLVSHWNKPASLVRGACEPRTLLTDLMETSGSRPFEECMMYWDLLTYLPGDILAKVDRAAMAVSLETRVPLLDHRVVEFAWSLPLQMRVRHGE